MLIKLPIKAIAHFWVLFVFTFFVVVPSQAQTEVEAIKIYLTKVVEHQEKASETQLNGLSSADINEMKVSSAYRSPSTGWYHAYFNQTYKGIEVFNALLNVTVKDGQVVHTTNQFVPNLQMLQLSEKAAVSPNQAVENAVQHLAQNAGTLTTLPTGQKPNVLLFQDDVLSSKPIEVQQYWLPLRDEKKNTLRLVWNVRFQTQDNQHWWNVRVDAQDGKVLDKNDWTVHCSLENCSVEHRESASTSLANQPIVPFAPATTLAGNTYNVFDIPLEAPNFGARTIVSNPYTRFVPTGTGPGATNGWHDDGTSSYTNTQGNNVYAQDDIDNNNATIGSSPSSATLDFNYPFTDKGVPADNLNAAITNLFYWNNLTHDVLYRYGFDEPSGNYQATNMGRGGAEKDFVFADAQDGSGTDNANFSAPPDGENGRMQMYLWDVKTGTTTLKVNSPAAIAITYQNLQSSFSTNNNIATVGPITGNVVLVSDAAAASLGCTTPFANAGALAGKIALVDRGSCTFVIKVRNCQNAGAIAVIVVNNAAGGPPSMGGSDNTITIPAFSISQADGVIFKNALLSGALNVTMSGTIGTKTATDGDFDNGVVSHEYGHGWSIRLTGGPANSDCLNNAEQGGEGWSDYLALMLTTNWSSLTPSVASANISRGIGTYVFGQATTGAGIRPFPYSYNMAVVNPTVTYSQVSNSTIFPIPHGVGSIWATMLWDMTWEIIFQDNAIVNDISNSSNLVGNIAALKLVNEGLRLQPCSPSFIQSRDAILAADELLFAGKYKCSIWKAFARRGLGVNASTGVSSDDVTVTEDFKQPTGVDIVTTVSPTSAPEGATVTYTVQSKCRCSAISNATISSVLPTSMTYVGGSASNSGMLSGNTITWGGQNFTPLASQTYTFQAKVNSGTYAATVKPLNDNFDGSTPAGAWVATANSGTTQWVTSSAQSNSPSNSVYAANTPVSASDFVYKSGLSFNLVGPATLTFAHRFFTEPEFDGGVVEISVDGGTSWQDLGTRMTTNGYNGILATFGRKGFTGDGRTWRTTTVDLEPFCGTTAQIRFRMLNDANTDCGTAGACGWYVDDVMLSVPSGANTTGNAVTTLGNSADNACLQILPLGALPIELVSFSATPLTKSIQLNWILENGQDFNGFDIMKSNNGKNFQKVAWVARQDAKQYTLDDDAVQTNIIYYYYLRSLDKDDKIQNSKIVSAQLLSDQSPLLIFPNPAKETVTIRTATPLSNKLSFSLRNPEGQLIKAGDIAPETLVQGFSLDCTSLAAGLYYLEYQSATLNGVEKLVINH